MKLQGPRLLEVKEGHKFFNLSSTRVLKESESKEGSTNECPENGYLMSFNKTEDLDLHLEIGQYKYYTTGSVYDQLKVDWASKFSALIIDERT